MGSAELECLERRKVVGFFGKDCERFAETERSSLIGDFGNESFVSGLVGHGGFIGFDLTNDISDFDLIAYLDIPLDDFTFGHGG